MVPQKVLWRPFFWSTTKKYDWDGKGQQSLISKRHNSSNLMIKLLCGEMKFLRLLLKDRTFITAEAVVQRCSVKKVFLKISQNSQENTCARVSFLIKFQAWDLQLCWKETLAQVFSCEFREVTPFYRAPPVVASVTNTLHKK